MEKKTYHILLVEDDKYFRMGIKDILLKYGVILEAENLDQAQRTLETAHIDLALIDIHLGEGPQGLEVLRLAQKAEIPSIVLSSAEDDDITEKAYEIGCGHFLIKRHYRKHLESYVRQITKSLSGNLLEKFFKEEFVTQDPDLKKQIKQLSEINLQGKTVFIGGETGTGKSLVGKLIHRLGFEEEAPFVHINCAEVPENLLEAELFGHKKGAFTGADKDRPGRLKQADKGVLFLDEIGTMPVKMQQKLLKALDEKTFYPVGSSKMEKSDFTLISATCEDLFEKVANKRFRKDLFFRISGYNLELKPLRERPKDIELLIRHTLKNSPRRIVIKKDAMEALKTRTWPGNVRELLKVCESLSLKSKGVVSLGDLPLISGSSGQDSESESFALISNAQKAFIAEKGLKEYVKILEQEILREALEKNNGKIAQTIKDLGISSSAFYRIQKTLQES